MIEINYKSIINTLSKLIIREILTKINNWITHLSAVLFVNQTIIKKYKNEFILNNL